MNKLTATHSFTVMPKDINYANCLFGGKLLYEMDYSGAKVIRRALYNTGCDGHVTAAMDKISFEKPSFLGDIITMTADIISFGKSSITVRIKVMRESLDGFQEKVCSANMVFVAMCDGKPKHHNLNFEKLNQDVVIN